MEIENRKIALYGIDPGVVQLNPIIELINELKIKHISVPLYHDKTSLSYQESREYIDRLLEDKNNYKEEDGVEMIAKKEFGLKFHDVYNTLILRAEKMKYNILLSAPSKHALVTWASQNPDIDDYFTEVKLASFVCLTECLETISEKGCNLCSKQMTTPVDNFFHALYSNKELTNNYEDYMANKIQSVMNTNQDNFLIMIPARLLHSFSKKILSPVASPLIFQHKVSPEELAIASELFSEE